MTTVEKSTGPAVAALIAVGVGLIALAVSHLLAELSIPLKDAIHAIGKAWMPGAQGIGPYSGKETIALVAWLGMWALLHGLWRRREVPIVTGAAILLVLLGVATTLLWPPVTEHVIAWFR